jgi:hypothetical protein
MSMARVLRGRSGLGWNGAGLLMGRALDRLGCASWRFLVGWEAVAGGGDLVPGRMG